MCKEGGEKMEDMAREIRHLRTKSLNGVERNKFEVIRNYKTMNPTKTTGYEQSHVELDTVAAFLMLRICVSVLIMAAFFASDIFIKGESVTVFQTATEQMSTNISINDVIIFFKSFSWDTLSALFK